MICQVVPTTRTHLRALALAMRIEDRAEIETQGLVVRHALNEALNSSVFCRTALVDGDVAVVGGVRGDLLSDDVGAWLLTTPAIERAPLWFFRETGRQLAEVMLNRRRIFTHVMASYSRSIRFFALHGFEVTNQFAMGPNGTLYYEMSLYRVDDVRLAEAA